MRSINALLLCLVISAADAGILYVDTGGSATNSGSTDQNSANLTGTAASVAGSVVTLDGSPDLSGVVTSGAAQSTIYINDATNSNQKIFWITAFDDTLNTVTVSVAPTGVTSSSWAIGGRIIHTPANVESALRAGDIYQFNNSPATATATYFTARTSGDNTGLITMRGKSGVRPVLNVTNTSIVLTGNAQTNWLIENLELDQDGASGNVASGWTQTLFKNIKIVDGGGDGIAVAGNTVTVHQCEISGVTGSGISTGAGSLLYAFGNYIHDNATHGINASGNTPRMILVNNIIDSNTDRGILSSSTPTSSSIRSMLIGNTIYGNGNSGLEVTDADTAFTLVNNIFEANGNAAGEYNVEWVAGTAEISGAHYNNVFYLGAGANNLLNLTADSTESTADPAFTNAAGGNFSIGIGSSAKATGYPGVFLGGTTGYMDMGPVQRQEPVGGGGGGIIGD